ncbi:MAG: penicillin acylase family protein [Candidatus Dormibacteria bacterium]
MRTKRAAMAVIVLPAILFGVPAGATGAPDLARAVNVVPPGESGFMNLATFAQVQAQGGSYGTHFGDQMANYADWTYKPFQFGPNPGNGTHPGGMAGVTVVRDGYGVPQIYADNETDLAYGIGYAMAQDRLFQMEVFRRVGHGTLSQLVGVSGLPMDELVDRVTEGAGARAQELATHPADNANLTAFSAGVNQVIMEATTDPTRMPAEFSLLGDLPIAQWTPDDTLAFGEYAGRFFGEFGHGELSAAQTYSDLVQKLGQPAAEKAFNDVYALNDPTAPTIIDPADGTFPHHFSPAVPTGFTGSAYANHDPALYGASGSLAAAAQRVDSQQQLVQTLQRTLGLPRFGSNAIVVDGTKTADGNPLLWSGPQTGWAVPGFFWEAEMHDPQRDERGVMVPAIPLMVIGRNSDSTFSVTSGLDANSDLFVEQLSADGSTYTHNGQQLPVTTSTDVILCKNPPTVALSLLNLPAVPATCPAAPVVQSHYHTIHGQGLTDPTASHQLFVRASAVDSHILDSFDAWDAAGLTHHAADFGAAMSTNRLCFNYFFANAAGEIAYFHSGAIPIRPVNADPTLPMPGTGAYDWQGFEAWSDMPHRINPSTHFFTNWNNKPAQDWYSKSLDVATTRWGAEHHEVPLRNEVASMTGITFDRFGTIPEDVAYIDNPARIFMGDLLPALQSSTDPVLLQVAGYLVTWRDSQGLQRLDGPKHLLGPAPTFFDRWLEHMIVDTLQPTLGADATAIAGFDGNGHYVSVDNLTAPTMKVEFAVIETLLDALRGRTQTDFLPNGNAATILQAAGEAKAELTATDLTADPSQWAEPVESAYFSPQGAGSVPNIYPLPNRGSYGQVVEPGGTP